MQRLFLLLILLLPLKSVGVVVVDSTDSKPLGGATLSSADGIILSITDVEGRAPSPQSFPYDVRCLGYSPLTVEAACDTVRLAPTAIELAGFTVTPGERPITLVRAYIREYSSAATSTDTLQLFSEYMADFFLTEKKVKGFSTKPQSPKVRSLARRMRYRNSEGRDTVANDDDAGMLVWVELTSLEPERHILGDSLLAGFPEIRRGEYGTSVVRTFRSPTYTRTLDALATHKDHHWEPWLLKMLGLSVDVTEMVRSERFLVDEGGEYGPASLAVSSFSMRMLLKGKWMKKAFHSKEPVALYSTIDIYPVSVRFLTREEALEERGDKTPLPIVPAPQAPEIPAFVRGWKAVEQTATPGSL